MDKLFFLFSGEHKTLPISELKAILESEEYEYQILEKLDQTSRIEADIGCVEQVKRRSALTRKCGLELFNCKADMSSIVEKLDSKELTDVLKREESFAVRVKRVKNYTAEMDSMTLESKIGEVILHKAEKTYVDLERPDKTFMGILTEGKFIFGVKLAEINPSSFISRRPKNKPFFHPSTMQPKLARCMVNLAKCKTGDLLFDPFCGAGSMLIEASLVGCQVLGGDIKRKMAKGSLRNLAYFDFKPEGILIADVRRSPITSVDCVVTDPPYGRSSTTMSRGTEQIMAEALESVHELLDEGGRVCMAAPKMLEIGSMGEALGYSHLESHFVYVHRSLTREIAVFEKV